MDNSETFYQKALEIDFLQAAVLREQCQLAHTHRKNKTALKAFTQCWGRSAKVMAKAYEWFGDHFQNDYDSVEQLRCLVIIAQCSKEKALALYAEWRENQTLSPYQWQLKVNALNVRQRTPKVKVKLNAQLNEITYMGQIGVVPMVSDNRAQVEQLESGGTYEVTFSPVIALAQNETPN